MKKRDWAALLDAVRDTEGGAFWVDALQVAIEGREPESLAGLLSANGASPPAALLPVIGDMIRDRSQPQNPGRPIHFTERMARSISGAFANLRQDGRTVEGALADLAELLSVSPDTIRRTMLRVGIKPSDGSLNCLSPAPAPARKTSDLLRWSPTGGRGQDAARLLKPRRSTWFLPQNGSIQ